MLVGGLGGCGLGSYLLVHLKLVAPKPFIIGLGLIGLSVALGAFAYVKFGTRVRGSFGNRPQQGSTSKQTDSRS